MSGSIDSRIRSLGLCLFAESESILGLFYWILGNRGKRPRFLILPSLNRCERCGKSELKHQKANREYKRDNRIPEWHGWHAARRGLGSNLYRLGVPDMVIQRILRHANVSTTATYYIKTAAADVRTAMATLENHIAESVQTQTDTIGTPDPGSIFNRSTVQ